jgi:iron complex transport system substrate-binding protein
MVPGSAASPGVSLRHVDAIAGTLAADGSVSREVQYVLDSALWKGLPAMKEGDVFGIECTGATAYPSALRTREAIDAALEPLPS